MQRLADTKATKIWAKIFTRSAKAQKHLVQCCGLLAQMAGLKASWLPAFHSELLETVVPASGTNYHGRKHSNKARCCLTLGQQVGRAESQGPC